MRNYVTGTGGSSLDTWYWIGRIAGYAIQFAAGFGIGFAIRVLITFVFKMIALFA